MHHPAANPIGAGCVVALASIGLAALVVVSTR